MLRVFQVTGVMPAVSARRLWGVPFVTTYGFWYAEPLAPGAAACASSRSSASGCGRRDAVIVTTAGAGRPRRADRRVGASASTSCRTASTPLRFAPGAAAGVRRPRRVLYVGRLEPEKNPGALVEAAARLSARDVRVCLVGAGSLEPALARAPPRSG